MEIFLDTANLEEIERWLAVVTNQSGVGRGFFGLDTVSRVNERMLDMLTREGATTDEIFVCPHRPDERCSCRKPGTLMLEMAAQRSSPLSWCPFW